MRLTVRTIILILASTFFILALLIILNQINEVPYTSEQKEQDSLYCDRKEPCPPQHLSFLMRSGAANVVGPRLCLEGNLILSHSMQNVGEGLTILFVNGKTGKVLRSDHFNMYSEDVTKLMEFMKDIPPSTLVFVLSFDDPATKLTDKAREIFQELGSTAIKTIGFRDVWLFVGANGIKGPSPFEVVVKNDRDTNKYDGWPEMAKLEGCVPLKQG
uniref:ILEI/PANDER domain-containing protein n=1 Tax=Eptatretus burgeri TaxID=7764 RepID=A0A8C4N2L2_EPTBU